MLKRWAAWPRDIRWLVGIAAVVLGLAIAWVLFVPIADWLAHHDVGSVKGSLHETAVDNARGRLLTLAAGVFAAGALAFTARNFTLSRRTLDVTEQGQVTDRYTKAIEQLGSDKLDVRIGGIYALERVARDSPRDHPTVMEVLAAFIRVHSHEQWPPPEHGNDAIPLRTTRPDVQAAVTVIGRRDSNSDRRRIDLTRADLSRADLSFADLNYADLTDADLNYAHLRDAHLNGAWLGGAHLNDAYLGGAHLNEAGLQRAHLNHAYLVGAHLDDAYLESAQLNHARLNGANLDHAHLHNAQLNDANLGRAHLNRAWLINANLTDVNLADAQLSGADLNGADLNDANLAGADLADAKWPRGAPVPEGWKLDTESGRLKGDAP